MDKTKLNEIISNVIYTENQKAIDSGNGVLCTATEYLTDKITQAICGECTRNKNVKTVILLVNDYIGDDFKPSRTLRYSITEECLMEYLAQTEDDRGVKEFLTTYDSDESEIIYEYATDDNRVLWEEITYCDDFMDEYNDHKHNNLKPLSAEEYYWAKYAN